MSSSRITLWQRSVFTIGHRRPRVGALLAALTLAILVPAAGQTPDSTPKTIKVVARPFLSYAPFFVAEAEGFFADEGLEVEFVSINRASAALPALVHGDVDVFAARVMPSFFNLIARGGRLRFVASKGFEDPAGCSYVGLVARPALITEGRLTDARSLAGLRIAVSRTSPNFYYVDSLLRSGDLTLDDVQPVDIPYHPRAAVLEAFRRESVDLTTVSEPWLTQFERTGWARLWRGGHEILPGFESSHILFGPTLLQEDPEAGRGFLVAYLKAVRQLNREGKTDRHLEILEQRVPQDGDLLRAACWPAMRDDGAIDPDSLNRYQEWAVGEGLVDRVLEPDEYLDLELLQAANERLTQLPGHN